MQHTIAVRLMPPLSLRRNVMFGGDLFSRNPKPSSSCSRICLCCSGFRTSRTMNIRLQVRATADHSTTAHSTHTHETGKQVKRSIILSEMMCRHYM